MRLLSRTHTSGALDIVVSAGDVPLSADYTMRLVLQDRHDRAREYLLAAEKTGPNCWLGVERVTDAEVVLSCTGEGSQHASYWKLIYDLRAKALVRQFRYAPFAVSRVTASLTGASFVASDGERGLSIEYIPDRNPAFRILGDAVDPHAADDEKPTVPEIFPALPITTYDQFAAARPRRVKDGYARGAAEIHDAVGPWQQDGSQIWFGKTFYDGEGLTGVGGFGYFDVHTHKLRMFSPPEIADWSVSAILVAPPAAWMGLAAHPEGPTGLERRFASLRSRIRKGPAF